MTASCRSGSQPAPAGVSSATELPAPPQLAFAQVTEMREDERGGTTVVLLHGYGARGDDLLSLARTLGRPHTRFLVPAAPRGTLGGGRAWWDIEASDRPRYVTDEPNAQPEASNPQLEAARGSVQALLARAQHSYAPEQLVIAGFSQGAMLALDVALTGVPAVQRVAVLSGALLTDAAARLDAPRAARPAVFISHGQQDTRLPYSGAERMKSELEQRGFAVTFQPFSGGHEIPDLVVTQLKGFLFG